MNLVYIVTMKYLLLWSIYDNELFYIWHLSLFVIIFPYCFHVLHCLVQSMVHYCSFICFSVFPSFLSPVYIVLLNVFICFNFNVFIVFSSEMFIAFPFFQVLFIVFDLFSGFICFIVYLPM